MNLIPFNTSQKEQIERLFTDTFTASDNEREGRLVGTLARELIELTPRSDLYAFVAEEPGRLVGCVMFSRLVFETIKDAFLLAPMGVATDFQNRGIGQALIRHGLAELEGAGIKVFFTYGDPAYYGRFGFRHITEEVARAPRKLSLPHGWLAMRVDGGTLEPISGPSRCAAALDRPELW